MHLQYVVTYVQNTYRLRTMYSCCKYIIVCCWNFETDCLDLSLAEPQESDNDDQSLG